MNKKTNLTQWALDHLSDWEIICGLRATGLKNNYRIFRAVHEAGFDELANMMSGRICQLLHDDSTAHEKQETPGSEP